MQVEDAIILSAGKGTRMGPVGKILAKPVWPYFGKTLLELQVEFLKQYGIKNFYINSHHLNEQLKFLESDTIKIIYEPTLLDQGGGILNIVKRFDLWSKPLLVNNADQLYFISKKILSSALNKLTESDAVLFGLKVEKSKNYNELSFDSDNRVNGIIKNIDTVNKEFQTYSGMALLRCEKENYDGRILPFFKSVADLKTKKVLLEIVESCEYYDFGKLDSYYNLCFETLDQVKGNQDTELTRFLNSIDVEIDIKSKGLNFTNDENLVVSENRIKLEEGEIFLEGNLINSAVTTKK